MAGIQTCETKVKTNEKSEWNMKIKDEVVKQLDAGYLEVTNYQSCYHYSASS